jgi:mannitol/fructose-specific phosphotransferase system IIA component (Ntr-type)
MISISSEQKLALLSPSTNRALAQVVKNSSSQQLKYLEQNSDLKAVLSSLFDESINSTKSDKILLDILKNSTAFKDMGSFSKDLSSLSTLMKSKDLPQQLEEALSKFIKSMDSIDTKSIKTQISNSGVFLESKLATTIKPEAPLKVILQDLQTLLQKSSTQDAKQINMQIKELLQNFKADNPKMIQTLSQNIQDIKNSLQALHVKADIIHSKPVQTLLNSLQSAVNLSDKPIDTKSIMSQVQELYPLILQSRNSESSSILGALEKIVSLLKDIEQNPNILVKNRQLSDSVNKVIDSLHVSIKNGDSSTSKDMLKLIDKLSVFTKSEAFDAKFIMNERVVNDMKANLLQLSEEIKQTPSLQNSDISKIVDKLSLQIDYYQLYSHLNNSSSIYFPFVWDKLEEGSLSIKKVKDDKFYCEINLNLKDYGELKVMLSLYNKNQINIHTFSDSKELKNSLQESVPILRTAFNNSDLILTEIRFFDKKIVKSDKYQDLVSDFDMGFEVKV